MTILIACEESQRVCVEFRSRGHIAFSCDILDPSGGHPEWHIKGDVFFNSKDDRSVLRSKTFPGIARAMADQWGGVYYD